MVRGLYRRSGLGWGTLREIQNGSKDPFGDSERVGNPQGGPGRVKGPSGRTGTGRGTFPEVRDSSNDHRGVQGRAG